MDKPAFESYLKKPGKRPHVIEGLTRQVVQFEQFLLARGKGLDSANEQDILDFVVELETQQPGSAGKGVRGVGLYYQFAGVPKLAATATEVREQAIAKHRNIFKLSDFRGVDPEHILRLKTAGIANAEQLLASGKTAHNRKELAERTGVPEGAILELVKLSDLSRIEGVKAIRARLYYEAGVDTVGKLAGCEPEELLRITAEFVERTGFHGIAPLPKEALHTIETARKLPKVIDY